MKYRTLIMHIPGKADPSGTLWLPLWMHSMDTAEIIIRLLGEWLPDHAVRLCGDNEAELQKICRYLALVHDIGKITPVFASKICEVLPEIRMRLESAGLWLRSPEVFPDRKMSPHARAGEEILLSLGCPEGIAAVVGSHHGKPQDAMLQWKEELDAYHLNFFGRAAEIEENAPAWDDLQREWLSFALTESGYSSPADIPEIRPLVQILLTGLLIMADWIASNPAYFPPIPIDSVGTRDAYPDRAKRAWEKLDLPEAWSPQTFLMDTDRFREVFPFAPNAVQAMMFRAANQGNGGIYILEAQMGVGKTEAALAAAEVLASRGRCGGVFFGLPTQATANGLFRRLIDWAKKQSEDAQAAIRLAHGMAELNEDYRAIFRGAARVNDDGTGDERLIVHPWFGGRKQALLANYVIGTVDQLLLSALKQKHGMLRHLGLSGKVVILDECHAYDAYMNQYLERALNWLGTYQVPVIMLSATLPEERRVRLVEAYLNGPPDREAEGWRTRRAYPLLTWTNGRELLQETAAQDEEDRKVRLFQAEEAEAITFLRDAVSRGGCCGVIVNTVRHAQELAAALAGLIPEARLLLLHSRFLAPDRAEKEKELLRLIGKGSTEESRCGLIVIGTQVLEQSLDIDFDLLITQLCPMDLLLQRIGRLHRHRRVRPEGLLDAECCVLPADDGSKAVYGEWLLLRTAALLPDEILLPGSIPELVQETYREPDETILQDPIARRAWEAHKNTMKIKEQKADSYRIQRPPSRRTRTIHGWLNTAYPADGVFGEAAVRDGASGITVLAMQDHAHGRITFLPGRNGGIEVPASHMPDEETARQIAGQRLTLPASFSSYGNAEKVIRALESLNRTKLPEWQNSPWLQGELVLLFDEQLRTELNGQELVYSKDLGLICRSREENKGNDV